MGSIRIQTGAIKEHMKATSRAVENPDITQTQHITCSQQRDATQTEI